MSCNDRFSRYDPNLQRLDFCILDTFGTIDTIAMCALRVKWPAAPDR